MTGTSRATQSQPHCVVVGGGIIGASIAMHIVEVGGRVTVLDRSRPASGATSKSFAWLNSHTPTTPEYSALRLASLGDYAERFAGRGSALTPIWSGTLGWDAPRQDLETLADQMRATGQEAHILGANEIAQLEPNLRQRPDYALHCPNEGVIDPIAATEAMLTFAAQAGATILAGCDVVGLATADSGTRVTGVHTNVGQIAADHVIIAAGVQSAEILAGLDVLLPMANRFGVIVHTEPTAPLINRILLAPELHFRQDPGGRILAAEDFSGLNANGEDAMSPMQLAEQLMQRLNETLETETEIRLSQVTCGLRPVPADGFPMIGPVEGRAGAYVAVMHSGITLAPVVGRLVATELLGGKQADELAAFRLNRFT